MNKSITVLLNSEFSQIITSGMGARSSSAAKILAMWNGDALVFLDSGSPQTMMIHCWGMAYMEMRMNVSLKNQQVKMNFNHKERL